MTARSCKLIVAALTVLLAPWCASRAIADVYVIAHRDAAVREISIDRLSHIALGQLRRLPDGTRVELVDQSEVKPAFHLFHYMVTGKSNVDLTAYWARRVFTGRSRPPARLANDREVLLAVSRDRSLIGYLSEPPPATETRVRVILRLQEPEQLSR